MISFQNFQIFPKYGECALQGKDLYFCVVIYLCLCSLDLTVYNQMNVTIIGKGIPCVYNVYYIYNIKINQILKSVK